MKEIPKFKLTSINRIYSYMNEPKILKKLIKYDNFVPKLIAYFQDYDNLYLITNYYEGNNLESFKNEILSEVQIKFISACIIQSLIYLRKEEIINRDVQMQNLIMGKDKYLNLIDYSFSINYFERIKPETFFVISPSESAPETSIFSSYDYNSDYYRLGVIIYYLIFKKYVNEIKKEKNISEIQIEYKGIKNYSASCFDFLNKLIITDYKKRIGFKNINELKEHHWFQGFNWNKLEKKKMKSPLEFVKNNKKYCNQYEISKKTKNKILKFNENLIEKYDFVNKNLAKKIIKYLKKI